MAFRYRFVENDAHGLLAGDQALFEQRAEQHDGRAQRRPRIGRIFGGIHVAFSRSAGHTVLPAGHDEIKH